MSTERAAEAQAYVRALLAQRDPAYALILESALNDELIERCQRLSAQVQWLAEHLALEADATSAVPSTYPASFWIAEAERHAEKEAATT